MHRLGRRIDFSARQGNIIRIIQSNESRASRSPSGFAIPSFIPCSAIEHHLPGINYVVTVWDVARKALSTITNRRRDTILATTDHGIEAFLNLCNVFVRLNYTRH